MVNAGIEGIGVPRFVRVLSALIVLEYLSDIEESSYSNLRERCDRQSAIAVLSKFENEFGWLQMLGLRIRLELYFSEHWLEVAHRLEVIRLISTDSQSEKKKDAKKKKSRQEKSEKKDVKSKRSRKSPFPYRPPSAA